MARTMLVIIGGLWLATGRVVAEDVWIARFQAEGGIVVPPCGNVLWGDDIVLHNTTDGDLTVEFIGTSNGTASDPQALTIPGHSTRAGLRAESGVVSSWSPSPPQALWVVHLDVPEGITLASRPVARISSSQCGGFGSLDFGGMTLPVFRSLAQPGIEQILLGADLGDTAGGRINVGVYNAGAAAASATIEIRRGCDDGVVERRTAHIPANEIVQVNSFRPVEPGGCSASNTSSFVGYVSVRVDQPSLSYAVTLSNSPPKPTMSTSITN